MNTSKKMKKLKLLFIPETYPSGLTGTSVKTRNTIEYLLAQGHSVDVACIDYSTLTKRELTHNNLRIFSIFREGIRRMRIGLIGRLFALIFSIKPVRVNRMYDSRLQHLIEVLEYSCQYDYVFFDGFSTLQYAQQKKKNYVYIDDEDISDLVYQRMLESRNILMKAFLFSEYLRCLLFEKKTMKNVEQVWAISPNSLKRLKTLSAAKMSLMPTIIPVQKNVFSESAQNIVFAGTLSWSENKVGLQWFITHCWSKVLDACPETKLFILGQQSDESWEKLCQQYKNIELMGYVENLETIFSQSAVAISPVFINSGIKIKVLTYLSYGLPVISSDEATWGMNSTDGILCTSKEKFTQNLILLLKNKAMRKKLSLKAQKNISTYHSTQSLDKFFQKVKIITGKK